MCRRDAEPEERGALIGHPADEFPVEKGRELGVEDRPLFRDRLGFEELPRIDAVHPCDKMRESDEVSEQSAFVEPAREAVDAAAPGDVAAFPIAAARLVEIGTDERAIVGDIRVAVGIGKEAPEAEIVGKPLYCDAFQVIQRDMRGVEVHRDDLGGIGGQIGKDIAAAACDRCDPVARPDCQRLHIDDRIFPNLGIDKALERQREGAVEQALLLLGIFAHNGSGDLAVRLCGHATWSP